MKDNEDFLKRTDNLALKLRLNLTDLARRIDLSDGSFFGYRTGRVTLSPKAWRKLESAEIAAGIGVESDPPSVESKEEELEPSGRDERLDRIEAALDRLTAAVEALACAQRPPTSSSGRGDIRKISA